MARKTQASGGAGSTGADTSARGRIMAAATAEFLDKGFQAASLRAIASEAGLTTGAIYGYFSSKSDLFDAIVGEAADALYEKFRTAQRRFYELPTARQSFDAMAEFEDEMIHELYDYIFDNREAFLLVFTKSAGTRWEHYVDRFVDIEVESTDRYAREMTEKGIPVKTIPEPLCRTLTEMFFRGYFQPLISGLTREETHAFISDYERFFHTGYRELMEG